MRDHGGDLDRARAMFGGDDWVDLSTGINPTPYPAQDIPPEALCALPTAEAIAALEAAAARAYDATGPLVALPGAQAAIQLAPRLSPPGRAAVVGPTYNEHAAALEAHGWTVETVRDVEALAGADLAVVVNPNNPDGRRWPPELLAALSRRVGLLVVDESFVDPTPELSLAPHLAELGERALVLRSFGKFYGLAGLRLGFAIGGPARIAALKALAGPWAVSGPAIEIGARALGDDAWRTEMRAHLAAAAARLTALGEAAGWRLVGATALFATFDTGDATAAQARLARAGVWSRRFPYSDGWLRLGLPGPPDAWRRLEEALASRL